jgi:hypothetical protein
MKITRSQLKNLIKEEMSRISEASGRANALSDSLTKFLDDKELTVIYQESAKNGGQWFQWVQPMPHQSALGDEYKPTPVKLDSFSNADKAALPPGSVLYPNDGREVVIGDDAASGEDQTQRRTVLNPHKAAEAQL